MNKDINIAWNNSPDTEHNNEDKKLPERCPCCFRPADFTDTITRDGEEYESDAWFCNICGGLVRWK